MKVLRSVAFFYIIFNCIVAGKFGDVSRRHLAYFSTSMKIFIFFIVLQILFKRNIIFDVEIETRHYQIIFKHCVCKVCIHFNTYNMVFSALPSLTRRSHCWISKQGSIKKAGQQRGISVNVWVEDDILFLPEVINLWMEWQPWQITLEIVSTR